MPTSEVDNCTSFCHDLSILDGCFATPLPKIELSVVEEIVQYAENLPPSKYKVVDDKFYFGLVNFSADLKSKYYMVYSANVHLTFRGTEVRIHSEDTAKKNCLKKVFKIMKLLKTKKKLNTVLRSSSDFANWSYYSLNSSILICEC